MPQTKTISPPQQARSQQTLARLMDATIATLDEFGLDGALIPRIAALAGVAPASVYRRFVNKDALIRAALLHMLHTSSAGNGAALASVLRGTLPQSATCLMQLLFDQYRQHPKLLRALSRFLDTDTDAAFVQQARAIVASNLESIVTLLLVHSDEITHADRKAALRFALLHAMTSIEAIALEPFSLWHIAMPAPDEELAQQLAQAFVAYLQRSEK